MRRHPAAATHRAQWEVHDLPGVRALRLCGEQVDDEPRVAHGALESVAAGDHRGLGRVIEQVLFGASEKLQTEQEQEQGHGLMGI
jgi:hypothetical protein